VEIRPQRLNWLAQDPVESELVSPKKIPDLLLGVEILAIRSRSNVWDYAGVNSLKPGRLDELAMHPTVKPVALVADAIKDCSRRNGLVLDPFAGSGTVLIAAERTGRRARALEIDPHYADVAVRRWETYTGKAATLAATGSTFEDISEQRNSAAVLAPPGGGNDELAG